MWRRIRWHVLYATWMVVTGPLVLLLILLAASGDWVRTTLAVVGLIVWVSAFFWIRARWRRQDFEPERLGYEAWLRSALDAVSKRTQERPVKPPWPANLLWLAWAIEQGCLVLREQQLVLGPNASKPIANPFDLPSQARHRAKEDKEELHALHAAHHFSSKE